MDSPFTFLCIAAPHKREGLELLLESYTKAFDSGDNVRLVLKLTYLPVKMANRLNTGTSEALLTAFRRKDNAPVISVITEKLSERQMGELYIGSDCYFSMTRAEAFGLCFLEALACGLDIAVHQLERPVGIFKQSKCKFYKARYRSAKRGGVRKN